MNWGPSTTSWIVCFGAMAVTLAAGGALTTIGPWYLGLRMPSWKPPNWAFAPVWTVIGICTAVSAHGAWRQAETAAQRHVVIGLFAVNAVLNIAWSLLFFKLRRPDWALGEVALLWLSIVALMVGLWPIQPAASLLLLPYLAWVSVASMLNLAVVRRNAPFTHATGMVP